MQDLVVDIGVEVTLPPQHLLDPLVAPARPVMRGQHHFGPFAVLIQRQVDVLGPGQGVTDLRAPKRVDIVEGPGDVLRGPEHVRRREPGVHLRRRLGERRVHKLHLHAVDRQHLDVILDDAGGRDQTEPAVGHVHVQALAGMAEGAGGQEHAILVHQPPGHGVAGVDVLRDGELHEVARRDDLDLAVPHVRFVHDAAHAAPVIRVGVGVDHRHDGSLAQVFVDQLLRGGRGFRRSQRVEHDPAGLALDERDIGQIEAAHLIKARYDFVQAVTHVQLGHTLQGGMDTRKVLTLEEEFVPLEIPDHIAFRAQDLPRLRLGDKTLFRLIEIPLVRERQRGAVRLDDLERVLRRRLALGMKMLVRIEIPEIAAALARSDCDRRSSEGGGQQQSTCTNIHGFLSGHRGLRGLKAAPVRTVQGRVMSGGRRQRTHWMENRESTAGRRRPSTRVISRAVPDGGRFRAWARRHRDRPPRNHHRRPQAPWSLPDS